MYYPIYVDVNNRLVVVIGGGCVAQRKVEGLLACGARVRLVSPEITDQLRQRVNTGSLEWVKRDYEPGDLAGAWLAFCACGVPDVDAAVCAEAQAENCLVNVADVPAKCDFILPSVMRRGQLCVSVSTAGAAPTEAKRIRCELEQRYDESWGPYLDVMAQVRKMIQQHVPGGEAARVPYYEAACNAGWRERIARGQVPSADEVFLQACREVEEQLCISS